MTNETIRAQREHDHRFFLDVAEQIAGGRDLPFSALSAVAS